MTGVTKFVLLLALTLFVQCDWIQAPGSTGGVPVFTKIDIPTQYRKQRPELVPYYVYMSVINSPVIDICAQTPQVMREKNIANCDDYFCGNKHSASFVNNATERLFFVQMNNFCYYCATPTRTVPTVTSFRRNTAACPYFVGPDPRHCLAANNQTFDGYAILFDGMYNDTSVKSVKPISPNLCYCTANQKYGFLCDAYTTHLIESSYLIRPWICFALNAATLIVVILINLVPTCHDAFDKWRRHRLQFQEICSIEGTSRLYSTRMQIFVWLSISLLLLCIEQIVSFCVSFSAFQSVREFLIGGFFRMGSVLFLIMALTALFILWVSVTDLFSKGLSRMNKITLGLAYVAIAVYAISFLIVSLVAKSNNTIIYAIFVCIGCTVLVLFNVGFTVYSVKIYQGLRAAKDVTFRGLKTTRFMIIFNIVTYIALVILILAVVGYFAGYDYMGVFVGLFRNYLADIFISLMALLVSYGTAMPKMLQATYGPCCDIFKKKSADEPDAPTTKYKLLKQTEQEI